MQQPLTIAFRNFDASEALEEIIRKRVDLLEQRHEYIVRCAVSVEAPRNHAFHGFPFEVCVELVVPGKNIVVRSNAEMHHANVDAYATIRHAFDIVERRLEDFARVQRHHVRQRQTGNDQSSTMGNDCGD